MEAVLTNGVDIAVGNKSFELNSRKEKIKDKHIYVLYMYSNTISID